MGTRSHVRPTTRSSADSRIVGSSTRSSDESRRACPRRHMSWLGIHARRTIGVDSRGGNKEVAMTELSDRTKDVAGDAAKAVAEGAKAAASATRDAVEKAADVTGDVVGNVAGAAANAAGAVIDMTVDAAKKAAEVTADAAKATVETAKDVAKAVDKGVT